MSRDDELLGLAQAAEEFDLAHSTLRNAAAAGTLKATKVAGVWLVTRAEVKRFVRDDLKSVGRPSKNPKDS